MQNKTSFLAVCLVLLSALIFAAEPYASITYAEGTGFTIIRKDKATAWPVSAPEVFGMTIERGDLIVTEASTFLEIKIHPISAKLQIAENTSFRCDADESGTKSSGELLYGRVRAKVTKLSSTSSYKITSPSLVAGVRGTDFGLDLIAIRPVSGKTGKTAAGSEATGTTAAAPILNRVFCFEGSVEVTETSPAAAAATTDTAAGTTPTERVPVFIGKNEMIEKLIASSGAAPASTTVNIEPVLLKKAVSDEVTNFWKPHPLSPDMITLPGGTFTMGSPDKERFRKADEKQHQETVEAFIINRYETTEAEWVAIMDTNPALFKSNAQPIERVNWYEILVYCNKRSLKEGLQPCYSLQGSSDPDTWGTIPVANDDKWNGIDCDFNADGYRLPTEAEWEYACRAGTDTTFNTGININTLEANYNGQFQNNRNTEGEVRGMPMPVGIFKANAFGLFDMHGNVGEWCWDTFDQSGSGSARVVRGGSWNDYGHLLRSASRIKTRPETKSSAIGFRVVCRL